MSRLYTIKIDNATPIVPEATIQPASPQLSLTVFRYKIILYITAIAIIFEKIIAEMKSEGELSKLEKIGFASWNPL